MNGNNGSTEKVKRSVVGSFGQIVGDSAKLAELQFRLLKCDVKQSSNKLILPLIVTIVGVLFLAGCFPILIATIGLALYEFVELPATASAGIALGIGLVIAIVLSFLGATGLKRSLKYFDRSIQELERNIQWLKQLKDIEKIDEARGVGLRQSLN